MRNGMWLAGTILAAAAVGCGGGGGRGVAELVEQLDIPQEELRFVEWVGAHDGLLVWDRNGNGIIEREDFIGGRTLTGREAETPYDDLRTLDTNGDSNVTLADGPHFNSLQIWQDKNGDGVASFEELQTLAEAGVVEIRTAYREDIGEYDRIQVSTYNADSALAGGVFLKARWSLTGTTETFSVFIFDLDGNGLSTREDVEPDGYLIETRAF